MKSENFQTDILSKITPEPTEEELIAIATALNLYYNSSKEEPQLTIKHNTSSCWNSKIFNINQIVK